MLTRLIFMRSICAGFVEGFKSFSPRNLTYWSFCENKMFLSNSSFSSVSFFKIITLLLTI